MSERLFDTAKDVSHALDLIDSRSFQDKGPFALATGIIESFEAFTYELYRTRMRKQRSVAEVARVEDLASELSLSLISRRERHTKTVGWYRSFITAYRQIWQQEVSLFLYCLFFFCSSYLLGWIVGFHKPEYAPVLIHQELLEDIMNHEAWFQVLQEDPVMGGISIAINNIKVAINCFVASALIGLGGIIILCFNGVFFGVVMGFCQYHGFHEELSDFVVSHGPLELTIIIAAAFSGLIYGRVFFQLPYSRFGERMRREARKAGFVLLGIVPWLVIAAIFEAFVSPWPFFSTTTKLYLGLALAVGFWLWTFMPLKTSALTHKP